MKRTTVFINSDHLKQLSALGATRGLKAAQLFRIAVDEYLRRELRKK